MEKITKILTISILGILVLSGIQGIATTKKIVTMDNHPPDAPKIKGPEFVKAGIEYKWMFEAIDPDGDNVSYEIDWGDGIREKWIGWYASGEKITRNHTYSKYAKVTIRARANDTYGAIGDWGTLPIKISLSTQIINLPFLQRFIELFPILEWIFFFFSTFYLTLNL